MSVQANKPPVKDKEKGFVQISDEGSLRASIVEVISQNPGQVAQYKSGKDKLFGFFVGQAMKATKGQGNPELINKILKEELSKYIKLAEAEEEVIITDHKTPRVKLVLIEDKSKPKLQTILPTRPVSDLKYLERPDPIPGLDVVALLREDRDAR